MKINHKSSNPALNNKTFEGQSVGIDSQTMSLNGVATKSFFMLIMAIATAVFGWRFAADNPGDIGTYITITFVITLGVFFLTSFKKKLAPFTAPVYALLQGFLLGMISQRYDLVYDSIVVQAVGITAAIFMAMLIIYRTGIIQVTDNFKMGVGAITGGIFLLYIGGWIIGFFGVDIPYIHESGLIGLAFSFFVILMAALNLVIDFDFIENGVRNKAGKHMEWYASFGLFVTLVWLYLEILRLLAKLYDR